MNDDVHLSKSIDFLRFPLCILVIWIHIPEGVSGIGQLKDLSMASLNWGTFSLYLRLLIVNWIAPIAVPLFFFFSGLLIYRKNIDLSFAVYKKAIKARFFTIVVPFILWGVLHELIKSIYAPINGVSIWESMLDFSTYKGILFSSFEYHTVEKYSWLGTSYEYTFPRCMPLWFLRDLFVLCLISPLLHYLCKRWCIVSFVIIFFFYITNTWFTITTVSIVGVFYFYLGILLSVKGWALFHLLSKYSIYICLIALMSLVYSTVIVFYGDTFRVTNFAILANSLSVLILIYKASQHNYIKTIPVLSKSSMFIYCWHELALIGGVSIVFTIFGALHMSSIIQFYFGPSLVALLGLAFYIILQKLCPRIMLLLCGK